MNVATLQIGDGDIAIEVTPAPGQQQAGLADKLQSRWEDVQPAIQKIASNFRDTLTALEGRAPNEAELSFGLKVAAEVGWAVAKAQGEGSFQITMKWSR